MVRPPTTGRPETEAEGTRRRRHGQPRETPGAPNPVWQEPARNGRAVCLYHYRGSDRDMLTDGIWLGCLCTHVWGSHGPDGCRRRGCFCRERPPLLSPPDYARTSDPNQGGPSR